MHKQQRQFSKRRNVTSWKQETYTCYYLSTYVCNGTQKYFAVNKLHFSNVHSKRTLNNHFEVTETIVYRYSLNLLLSMREYTLQNTQETNTILKEQ
jgi:hypothetical protein